MARKRTDVVKLQLRLLEGLRRRLEHVAADNKHSMNTEIIERLEASFRHQDQEADRAAVAAAAASNTVENIFKNPDVWKLFATVANEAAAAEAPASPETTVTKVQEADHQSSKPKENSK
jgi:hypothetical protein